jgi:hypothetical protein
MQCVLFLNLKVTLKGFSHSQTIDFISINFSIFCQIIHCTRTNGFHIHGLLRRTSSKYVHKMLKMELHLHQVELKGTFSGERMKNT